MEGATDHHSHLLYGVDDGFQSLVETSCYNPPVDFFDLLEKIQKKGFHPLLAHPKRYMFLDRKDLKRLSASGVRMQLNFLSLTGFYGDTARKKAEMLLKDGFYCCMGGDLHGLSQARHLMETTLKESHLELLSAIKNGI